MSAALETVNLPHLPETLFIHVALYRNVQNAPYLREQLLTGNADFEYAFIDASMVGHRSFRQFLDLMQGRFYQEIMRSQRSSEL